MRALYQIRRDWMIAATGEVYGDLFFTEQNDGGMHIVAFLAKEALTGRLPAAGRNSNYRLMRFRSGIAGRANATGW